MNTPVEEQLHEILEVLKRIEELLKAKQSPANPGPKPKVWNGDQFV